LTIVVKNLLLNIDEFIDEFIENYYDFLLLILNFLKILLFHQSNFIDDHLCINNVHFKKLIFLRDLLS
jgi:hypothetical protein